MNTLQRAYKVGYSAGYNDYRRSMIKLAQRTDDDKDDADVNKKYTRPGDLSPEEYERRLRRIQYIAGVPAGSSYGALVGGMFGSLGGARGARKGALIGGVAGGATTAGILAVKNKIRDYLGYSGVRGAPIQDMSMYMGRL